MSLFAALFVLPLLTKAQDDDGCPDNTNATDTLCVTDDQDNLNVMGDDLEFNKYAPAMAVFKGCVYIGTVNTAEGGTGLASFNLGQEFASEGGAIFQGCRTGDDDSPLNYTRVVTGGFDTNNNLAIYELLAIDDYLYATTYNDGGFELWQTTDGTTWTNVFRDGITNEDNTGGRSMIKYKSRLYIGTENRVQGAMIYRIPVDDDGAIDGPPEIVASRGFTGFFFPGSGEDIAHNWWCELEKLDGILYCGTLNIDGAQLWASSNGASGTWEPQFIKGLNCATNIGILDMHTFDGKMYIGSLNILQGGTIWVSGADQGANEVEFEDAFEFFEEVVVFGGPQRLCWGWTDMVTFNGRLYAGCFNFLTVLGDGFIRRRRMQDNISPFFPDRVFDFIFQFLQSAISQIILDLIEAGAEEGFVMISSDDPTEGFDVETDNGFGIGGDLGLDAIGSMAVLGDELVIAANTFFDDEGFFPFRASARDIDESPESGESPESDESDDSDSR